MELELAGVFYYALLLICKDFNFDMLFSVKAIILCSNMRDRYQMLYIDDKKKSKLVFIKRETNLSFYFFPL